MMLKAWLKHEHSFGFLLNGFLLALSLCLVSSQAVLSRTASTMAGAVFDARLLLAAARPDVCGNSRHIQCMAIAVTGSYWMLGLADGSCSMFFSPKQFKINDRIKASSLFGFFNPLKRRTTLR